MEQRLSILNHWWNPAPDEEKSKVATSWKMLGSLHKVSLASLGEVWPLFCTNLVGFESDWINLLCSPADVFTAEK